MYVIDVIREAAAKVRADIIASKLKRDKFQAALAFNRLYTYNLPYFTEPVERLPGTAMFGILPKAVAAWMCPDCNNVHKPVSCSVWSGIQFPACCGHAEGHRQLKSYATDK